MPGRSFSSDNYRYGFNGQEKDDEVSGSGNSMTAEFWQYDSRLGRRWNTDPVTDVSQSPYACFNNNPIIFNDVNGDCPNGDCEDAKNVSGGTISIPRNSSTSSTSDGQVISFMSEGNEYWFDPETKGYTTLGNNRRAYDPRPADLNYELSEPFETRRECLNCNEINKALSDKGIHVDISVSWNGVGIGQA